MTGYPSSALEAMSAVLLAATDSQLATCPLSQPLEIGSTRELLRDRVLDGAAFPQMVLRVGWAPVSSEPIPASPRRVLDEVLSGFLEGRGTRHQTASQPA